MSKPRDVKSKIEIDAPAEDVWNAISEAEGLMRWFSLDARSEPGQGGSIWYSWGPPYEGKSEIEIWDPPRRLKLRSDWGHVPEEQRREMQPNVEQIAMDFTLESEGGTTLLRLVHSGFNADAEWDDEVESTRRGWIQELLGLKYYLERHLGQDRKSVWARAKAEISREEAWRRLTGASGLNIEGLKENESFDRTTSNNERLQGRVLLMQPPTDFCAVIENLNDAYFRVSIEKSSKPRPHSEGHIWLSTYDLMNAQVMAFQTSWTKLLCKLFPEEFKA